MPPTFVSKDTLNWSLGDEDKIRQPYVGDKKRGLGGPNTPLV